MTEKVKDRRVRKSQESFKEAFCEMVVMVPFEKITVTALANRADLNRKTFYSHFDTMEDLMRDIEQDCVNQVNSKLEELDENDLTGGIYAFYDFLNTDDRAIQTLLYGEQYSDFSRRFVNDVMTLPFFQNFCRNEQYEDLLPGYFDAVTGIFLRWRKKSPEDRETLGSLAEKAGSLIYNGISGLGK